MLITVAGRARRSLPPERATLRLRLGFETDEMAQSLDLTTRLVHKVSQAIEEMKLQQPSPTTWSAVLPVSTRSHRPYSQQGKVLPLRHSAWADVLIKFSDFGSLARFCDQWGRAEGVTIARVEWTLTLAREDEEKRLVLEAAVRDAQQRAQIMASAAGAGTVRFVQLADPGLLGVPTPLSEPVLAARSMARDAGGSTDAIDLTPEDINLETGVHARFETTDPS